MSTTELGTMQKTGMVQESLSGTTHVTWPSNPDAFKAAKAGSVFAEFNVPRGTVTATSEGWGKIIGPNSLEGRLAARKGLPVPQMPPATGIKVIVRKP